MAFSKNEALQMLRRATDEGRLAHAYLISGDIGCGKRALAEEFVGSLTGRAGFSHPDVHLAEPESKSRRIVVEQIRELEHELQMRALSGGRKIAVIVDADRMVDAAANAFLKTLEEPPNHSLLLLLTSQREALRDTIISRCIGVRLMATEKPTATSAQRLLLAELQKFFATKKIAVSDALRMVRGFQRVLQSEKAAIQEENEALQKAEEKRYKQTTDGKWLAERENYFKALTEARYVEARERLLDVLTQWFADALRTQQSPQGGAPLDLPEAAAETSRLASRYSTTELLRKFERMELLRTHLRTTGMNEQLSVETALLTLCED